MKHHIKLDQDSLMALLQGKDFHIIITEDPEKDPIEIVITPPFEGRFLTYKEIDEIKYESQNKAFNFILDLKKKKNPEKS